jgi:hypothetical protein
VIPFLLMAKPVGDFFKSLPREVWYGLALVVILLILRGHWINLGTERCEATQAKALEKALAESAKQEKNAPVIAQEARDAVKPMVEERIRYVQKYNTVSCDEPYAERVQQAIREAATSSDNL